VLPSRPIFRPGVRSRKLRLSPLVAALALGLALGACTTLERRHGYLPPEEDLAEIVIGVDTRDSVIDLVGAPTTGGVLPESALYYVGDVTQTFVFRAPEIVEREIVAVTFEAGGTVSNITRYGLEDGRVVPLTRRVTETTDGDIGFLRRLFGNVGGIDTSTLTSPQ